MKTSNDQPGVESSMPSENGMEGPGSLHRVVRRRYEPLDYALYDDGDHWEVWTPDHTGACIGGGATQADAIEDARLTLLATAAAIGESPNIRI